MANGAAVEQQQQLMKALAKRMRPFAQPLNTAPETNVGRHNAAVLKSFMTKVAPLPSPDELARRDAIVITLRGIVDAWVRDTPVIFAPARPPPPLIHSPPHARPPPHRFVAPGDPT